MNKPIFTLLGLFAAVALTTAYGAPRVDQSALIIDTDTFNNKVKVTYTLTDEPAIITLDVQTNILGSATWTSIGPQNIAAVSGEANKVVEPGTHNLWWTPSDSWKVNAPEGAQMRFVVKAWSKSSPPDYMILDLQPPYGTEFYEDLSQIPHGIQSENYKRFKFAMRRIHAAGVTWRMGSGTSGRATEVPHYVRLTKDYYIGIYQFTQFQYHAAIDPNHIFAFNSNSSAAEMRPVDNVPWTTWRGDLEDYNFVDAGHNVAPDSALDKLRAKYPDIGLFDLPSDAQWEFAARAGCPDDHYFTGSPDEYSSAQTQEVGLLKPNAWGLYDVEGNIAEWTLDILTSGDAYGKSDGSVTVDPQGGAFYSGCVGAIMRGNSGVSLAYRDDARVASTDRNWYGVRLVCILGEELQ